jgi:CubicO group peptidase (beta-lactamase class C family)
MVRFMIALVAISWAATYQVLPKAFAQSQRTFPSDDQIRAELHRFVHVHHGAPGAVVGIIEGNDKRVVAVGESGCLQRAFVDGDTLFEIGSVTKTLTGTLLADMILAGEVSGSERVSKLLPHGVVFDNGIEDATLVQLATHTSGMPRVAVDFPMVMRILSVDPYRGTTKEGVFRSASKVPSAMVHRQNGMVYSNLGYAFLGRLLEERTGVPYETLLRKRVLVPLGIEDMRLSHSECPPDRLARGHGVNGRPACYWQLDGYAPAGCVIASANDMLGYIEANLGPTPMVTEAQRKRTDFSDGKGIGLAWMHSRVGGQHLIWHDGHTGGFSAFVGLMPEERRGFVILANGQGDVNALARRLLDPSEPMLESRGGTVGYGFTLILILWGPLLIIRSIRDARAQGKSVDSGNERQSFWRRLFSAKSRRRSVDRLEVFQSALSPLIALILAHRLGAWFEITFAIWWAIVGSTVVLYAILLSELPRLSWYRPGKWRALGRIMKTLLEVVVIAALWS